MAYLEITNLTNRKLVFDRVYGSVIGRTTKRIEITTSEVERLRPSLITMRDAGIISFDHVNIEDDGDDDTEFVSLEDLKIILATTPVLPSSGVTQSDQPVTGVLDGVNTVFTSPTKWIRTADIRESLFFNGQRLTEGVGNDYVASESVPTSGYDTLTLTFSPFSGDVILLDFIPL